MTTITADNLTDAQVSEFRDSLPRGHYMWQWTVDAVSAASPSHPHRKTNARRAVAAAINDGRLVREAK
jgi:hypothetical protein